MSMGGYAAAFEGFEGFERLLVNRGVVRRA
jgi:hypothetical protein